MFWTTLTWNIMRKACRAIWPAALTHSSSRRRFISRLWQTERVLSLIKAFRFLGGHVGICD
jgi:hypothetical protein